MSGRTISRRRLLCSSASTAAAFELGVFEFASSLFAGEPKPAGKPRVNVVYVRPPKPPIMSWPGGNCDTKAQQALFTKALREAGKRFDVELCIQDKPVNTMDEVKAYVSSLKQSPPDGLIIGAMSLMRFKEVKHMAENRGDMPAIIYSHVSGFTKHLNDVRDIPKCYLGATQSIEWLGDGLRMLSAIWRIKNTRVYTVWRPDRKGKDVKIPLGTEFIMGVSKEDFVKKALEIESSDEVRAIADFYAKTARKVIEPSKDEVLQAAKNYILCRKLMDEGNCHAITMDCLGIKDPVCVAFSRLLDEGIVAACECDQFGAVAQLITTHAFGRPGFIQDPSPNTVNNTLIGAHCTSPTKLKGFDHPYRAPFELRSYHTRTGVSPQVFWPVGDVVTVIEFGGWNSLLVGTGKVVSNIKQPPTGCCRTAVEISIDGARNTLDTWGFHQVFVWGKLEQPVRALAQLMDLEIKPICG